MSAWALSSFYKWLIPADAFLGQEGADAGPPWLQRGSHHWHSIQIRCVVSWKHQTLVLAVMSLDSAQPGKLCWFPCRFFVLVKMSPDPIPCCGCGVCQSCVRCLQSRVSFPKYNDKEKRQHSSDIIFFRIPRLLISRVSFAILSKIPQLSWRSLACNRRSLRPSLTFVKDRLLQ